MVNLQDMIIKSDKYKTIRVDDLLFVQYQCFVSEDQSSVWSHNNYFAYVIGGRKMWRTQNEGYMAESGDALFVKKGAHTVYQYFEEKFYVIFIFLPDEFIYRTLRKHQDMVNSHDSPTTMGDSVIRLEMNSLVQTFFQSMISYLLEPEPPPPGLLRLKMEELILSLFARQGNELLKQYFSSLGLRRKSDLREIMDTCYNNSLSLNDYARLCARSLSTFRRDFIEIYGTTPGKWLMEKRLSYSRFLLETSDNTISDIVDECGFKNRSHFIRVFRETYGYPPNQFRMRNGSF